LAELPAEMTGAVDVAVLGGGVAGLSAAASAAKRGARVLLLEALERLGMGATGQNAGILSAGINMGLADVEAGSLDAAMWPATTNVLLDLVEQAGKPDALVAASRTGSLSLAESASAVRHLEREAKARVSLGLHAEMWTPLQVAEATGGRIHTADLRMALWLPDEGRLNPLTLLAHLAREAQRSGVTLAGDALVVACETGRDRSGSYWRLRIASGTELRARALVRAVGPMVQPTARIAALAFAIQLPDEFPLFWDARPYTYCDFRPGRDRLVASGGRYGRPGAVWRDALYHGRLADAARHWLPELAQVQPTHAWAVDLAVTADLSPRLHALEAPSPGIAIEGLGALGVLPGIVLGRRAGEMVTQRISRK
jgi:glycine/D-amino acid oxidase-like deaminating enzyme